MLKLIGACLSLFLIAIIFLRVPRKDMGLASFASTSKVLGSPSSANHFLNVLTVICIMLYFGIALQLNLANS